MSNKPMKNLLLHLIMLCLTLLFLGGCQLSRPARPSAGKDTPSASDLKPVTQLPVKAHLRKIEARADELAASGSIKQALNKYNYLIPRVPESVSAGIINKIEAVLPLLEVQDVEKILKSDKNAIPESILLYRLGIAHASKGDYDRSRQFLSEFLDKYPAAKDAGDAEDILRAIEQKITQKTTMDKTTIGCILPLSGRFGVFGQRALKGVQLALMDISAENKNKIRILVKDSESDNERSAACVRELISDNVSAIAGPMVTAKAAAQEAQKNGIPMVVMTQKNGVIETGDYIFVNFLTPDVQVEALVSHAVRHLNVNRFAIMYPDDRYGKKYMNLYWDIVKNMGGELDSIESYDGKQTDFSNIIEKLVSAWNPSSNLSGSPYGALFIPDSPSKVSLILPQLVYNEIGNIYLLGTNIWHSDVLLKNAADYAQNAVITDGYFPGSLKDEPARFAKKFQAAYGSDPGFIEAIAYDTVSILIKTSMEPSVESRQTLKEALAGQRIFNGVTGKTMFEASGKPHKELFFITVKNRIFVELDQSPVSEP